MVVIVSPKTQIQIAQSATLKGLRLIARLNFCPLETAAHIKCGIIQIAQRGRIVHRVRIRPRARVQIAAALHLIRSQPLPDTEIAVRRKREVLSPSRLALNMRESQ